MTRRSRLRAKGDIGVATSSAAAAGGLAGASLSDGSPSRTTAGLGSTLSDGTGWAESGLIPPRIRLLCRPRHRRLRLEWQDSGGPDGRQRQRRCFDTERPRRVPAPTRIEQEGASMGGAIGLPGFDDALGLLGLGDDTDGPGLDAGFLADAGGEGDVIAWSHLDLLRRRIAA